MEGRGTGPRLHEEDEMATLVLALVLALGGFAATRVERRQVALAWAAAR